MLRVGQRAYYERQFDTLKSFEEVDTVMASDSVDEENLEEQAQHERAMRISNYANVALLAFKVVYQIQTPRIEADYIDLNGSVFQCLIGRICNRCVLTFCVFMYMN